MSTAHQVPPLHHRQRQRRERAQCQCGFLGRKLLRALHERREPRLRMLALKRLNALGPSSNSFGIVAVQSIGELRVQIRQEFELLEHAIARLFARILRHHARLAHQALYIQRHRRAEQRGRRLSSPAPRAETRFRTGRWGCGRRVPGTGASTRCAYRPTDRPPTHRAKQQALQPSNPPPPGRRPHRAGVPRASSANDPSTSPFARRSSGYANAHDNNSNASAFPTARFTASSRPISPPCSDIFAPKTRHSA